MSFLLSFIAFLFAGGAAAGVVDRVPGPQKNFSGFRLRTDSNLFVYHHDQTIGVVELAPDRKIFNCELLEVRSKADKRATLEQLKSKAPGQLGISLPDMFQVMKVCQGLEGPPALTGALRRGSSFRSMKADESLLPNNRDLSSVFQGVFPGTKWCGAGDVAESYHDLGEDRLVDKCCRTHDLCPVKVLGHTTKYNLTNYSPTTRSHCDCDDMFYDCLKTVNSRTSNFLGFVYFNVLKSGCVENVDPDGKMKRFTIVRRYY